MTASSTTPTSDSSRTRSPRVRRVPTGVTGGGTTCRAAGGVSAGDGGGAEMIRVNSLGPENTGGGGGTCCGGGGTLLGEAPPPTRCSKYESPVVEAIDPPGDPQPTLGGGVDGGNGDGMGATGGGAAGFPNSRVYSPGVDGGSAGCDGGAENPVHAEPNAGSIGDGGGDLGAANGPGGGAAWSANKL